MLHARTKIIAATFIATLFQWLEYSSYLMLFPVIASLFYPADAPKAYTLGTNVSTLLTYAALPLGALFFGTLGDCWGRKKALTSAIFLMGISSLLLAYLPTYSQIGLTAVFCLLAFRLLQTLAFAGSLIGSSLFLIEQRKNYYPNLVACWIPVASGIGLLLAFMLTENIDHQLLLSWGWRIPFFLSAVSCIIAAYLRFTSRETPPFMHTIHRQDQKFPLLALLKTHKLNCLKALAIAAFVVIYFDICSVYYYHILITVLRLPHFIALSLLFFQVALFLTLLPIIAFITDKIGGRSIMLMGLLGCSLSAALLFISAPSKSLFILFFVEGFFAFFTASALAPLFRFQVNLFSTPVRYTGLSLIWALSLSVLSGLTIELAQNVMDLTHWLLVPALLASASALLIFVLIFFIYPSNAHRKIMNSTINPEKKFDELHRFP